MEGASVGEHQPSLSILPQECGFFIVVSSFSGHSVKTNGQTLGL